MRHSLWRSPALLLLAAAASLVQAVYKDEVGHVDYHYELMGVPQIETTLFHRPRKDDRASLLYTLSDVGVVGAVNPGNGAAVWRQVLTDNSTQEGGHLRAADGEDWVVSAYGNSVQAWNALSGRNTWWMDFSGQIKDLELMEMTGQGRKDVLVLFEEDDGSATLRRLHGQQGSVVWEFRDHGNDVPLQVSNNIESVFLVSLIGTVPSQGLRVSVHDPATGRRIDDIPLAARGEVSGQEDIIMVGGNSASPILAWTDKDTAKIKVNVLGTKTNQEFPLPADTVEVAIHAPHQLQSEPHFLVHSRTNKGNKGEVYHINLKTNDITRAYELPLLPGLGVFSTSSEGANVYFTRVTEDEVLVFSSESHAVLGRWPNKLAAQSLQAVHGVSEVVKKTDQSYAVRSAVVTNADEWVLVRNGETGWRRPEGLSGGVAAVIAEIPKDEELAKTLEQEAHSSILSAYIHRVKRHMKDLERLPEYLASVPGRFLSSILDSDAPATPSGLARDSFGFNQVAILATKRGSIYALNTGDRGRMIWAIHAFELPRGQLWDVKGIFVQNDKGLVTVRGSRGDYVIAKMENGEIVEVVPPSPSAAVQATAIVDSPLGQFLLPVGLDGKVGDLPASGKPAQTVVVRGSKGELKGLTWVTDDGAARETVSWEFSPPAGETIVEVATRAAHDPIAQIGRVLGDRRVRYKYLNPNTAVVAGLNAGDSILTMYLLDTVSGQILSSAKHEGVDGSKGVDCVMAENWFACTFFGHHATAAGQGLKGYQMVVTDLYESDEANDRGPLGSAANFSSLEPVDQPTEAPLPSLVTQAWVLSGPMTALAVTQTRQGISSRQVLAYLPEEHGIVGIPRHVLDPRRTVGRDPTPQEMEAEGLIKYGPVVEVDPRQVVSHLRDVVGVREIVTAPAVVESTSLVFVYGVDVFGTRVSPSMTFDMLGKGFDKLTLIGTVASLVVGVAMLRPYVRKKQTDLRWKAPR
ncbi:hypothetical protein ACRALDRAFT_1079806 [Sodiomyces alcalophilus JCM 7366]|uniref:uncharacterized protein n=1 Tax=Sodiomyces alcalophilus JCM 7366 TaxID=591952 RepID=UPI0039B62C2A